MRIVSVGGGPAGLYLAILLKRAWPDHEIVVHERNALDDTFGFGVVFSDATLESLGAADPESLAAIREAFYHWDDIHIHYRGEVLRSTGHGFAGMSRVRLLQILAARCRQLGVELRFDSEVTELHELGDTDLVVGADGVRSRVRELRADVFRPSVDLRPNRFVWLGTTRPYPAFTFDFVEDRHGLWRLHAYQYLPGPGAAADRRPSPPISTFIVETTDEAFTAAGLDEEDEEATLAFCERLFADHLGEHRLIPKKSIWRRFPTVRNERWHAGRTVLVGDAAHTAHFSVGSGTKLAMEDAIALRDALGEHVADHRAPDPRQIEAALAAYERVRRPEVESLQRAARASLQWFEGTERYMETDPVQFGFNLLTRSLRITHDDLKVRDPGYVRSIDRWVAAAAASQSGVPVAKMGDLPWHENPMVTEEARRPESGRAGDSRPGGEDDGPAGDDTGDAPGAAGASTSGAVGTVRVPPPMFTPFRVRDLLFVNRVAVSAMCQYSASDGTPDEWHFVHLGSRAVGGAGLIMTEMTDISPGARITPGCAGMYRDEHVAAWQRIVDFVHERSHARIGLQLAHAGRKGATRLAWEGMDQPLPESEAWEILSASPIPWFEHSRTPREMDRDDMDRIRDDFVAAAGRAEAAGFDLLELHFAHGYLLSSFISPLTNERDDEYGGPLADRLRYPLEVFDAVRDVWPGHKPVFVRISATDWAPGGTTADDAVEIGRMLKAHGCDVVDVSAGQTVPHAKPAYGRQFQTPFADRIRHEAGIPTMAVGNISSYMDVNTIIASGRADLCALARAHLWDPYWTRNAAWRQGWDHPWPDPYSVLDDYRPRFE